MSDKGDQPRILVIGARGSIGATLILRALDDNWSVTGTGRGNRPDTLPNGVAWIRYDPLDGAGAFAGHAAFDAVCWSLGANMADSLLSFDPERHLALYRTNCLSVMESLSTLVTDRLLAASGARLCVISSIWQERARQDKFSYSVTKAAVGGLVRAASVDLGIQGHLINAVLPGVLDTPMTASNLTPDQIAVVQGKTTLGRLADLGTVADTVLFLCSSRNRSITGQSITVDMGMSNASLV